MTLDAVTRLVQTLLYEGYLLYPYRRSSGKNRHHWMFGTLYPRSFAEGQGEADPWWTRTECLAHGDDATVLSLHLRFLHLAEAGAIERQVDPSPRRLGQLSRTQETVGFDVASADGARAIRGALHLSAERLHESLFKIAVRVENVTGFELGSADDPGQRRDAALPAALASTHVLMTLRGGEFISLLDPPEPLKDAAGRCRNVGTWPVLVGDPGARDTILSAPIILADYPQVASESPGDFFDATEIDEMLTLRVLTLTDEEKHAMRDGDPRARALLTRTEALADAERRRLHGASRRAAPATTAAPGIRPGMRVRLVPRGRSDIFDIALAGRAATVTSIEEDYEGRIFLAVTIDDDPGQDLGAEGRPGHRFYFRLDEVERLS